MGHPIIFKSAEETVDYARLHSVQRWMVFGDPDGWWPLYTRDGPVDHPQRKAVDHRRVRQRPGKQVAQRRHVD